MKPLLHPVFKLNGLAFSTPGDLKQYANQLISAEEQYKIAMGQFIKEWLDEEDFITVHTSGSTGIPKKIKLAKEQVKNSAIATANYFGLKENSSALLCLSADYIAGKMMLVRAMVSGWELFSTEPSKNPFAHFNTSVDFAAMVPYQAYHSLRNLNKVKKLIVGGGAVSKDLEQKFQKLPTCIFATYGMTETISHIGIRPLNGPEKSHVYAALPNVKFTQDSRACLQISAPDINDDLVRTNDIVELISPTSFRFLGRYDNVINSGGVKIHPEIIEEKLSAYINLPFFIAAEKDEALGERVILIIENNEESNIKNFDKIFSILSNYEKPKKIYNLPKFIYTETGKIKRSQTLQLLNP